MKKRFLSVLLTLAMVLTLVPGVGIGALASGETDVSDGIAGTLTPVNFTVQGIDFAQVTVDKPADQWIYDEPVMPSLTVKDGDGITLNEGTDYQVVWQNNDKAGMATATIKSIDGTKTGPSTSFQLYAASASLQGSGTAEDPYLLANRYDMQFLAYKVNTADAGYRTACYKMTADIDLTPAAGEPENDPIGINASVMLPGETKATMWYAPFAGTFDGDGHTVTLNWNDRSYPAVIGDMAVSCIYYLGLFGYVGTATNKTAGLAVDWNTTVTIRNLTVEGSVCESQKRSVYYSAAVIADAASCQLVLRNVTNNADMTMTAPSTTNAGGVIGYSSSDDTLINVVNNGSISTGKSYAGGIYGSLFGSGDSGMATGKLAHYKNLKRVINNGTVTSGSTTAGGIGGTNNLQTTATLTMEECANTGDITSATSAAGLLPAGGAYGSKGAWILTACYNSGNITSTKTGNTAVNVAGLLAGAPYGGLTMTDCYNTGDLTNATTGTYSTTAGLVGSDRTTTSAKEDRVISGYNAGTINAAKNAGALIGYSQAGADAGKATETSPYVNTTVGGMYLDGQKSIGTNVTTGGTVTDSAVAKTAEQLKTAAADLGESFAADFEGEDAVNKGFPILKWQNVAPYIVFDDGLGGKVTEENYKTWTHSDYTLEGWYYDNEGTPTKLEEGEEPQFGMTYTAKWTKNGKAILTEPLNISLLPFAITDKLDSEGWKYDNTNNTLTLDGATIDCSGAAFDGSRNFALRLPVGAKIVVAGDSTVIGGETTDSDQWNFGIYNPGTMAIGGTGKLTAVSGGGCEQSFGIYTGGTLTISCDVEAIGGEGSRFSEGIYAGGLTVSGQGTVVTAGSDAVSDHRIGAAVKNGLSVEEGATLNARCGDASVFCCAVESYGDVSVNGTLNLYGACAQGGTDKLAMYLNKTVGADAGTAVLTLGANGKITSDGSIKTENPAGIGNLTDQFYTVFGAIEMADGKSQVLTPVKKAGEPAQTIEITLREYTATFTGLTGADAAQVTTGYVTKPAAEPTREGYTFVTWGTSEEEFADAFNFKQSYIRMDTTFYPIWVSNKKAVSDCTGTAKDSEGNPIENAWVSVTGNGGTYSNTASDENGNFTFENLPDGIYNIQIFDLTTGKICTSTYIAPDDTGAEFRTPAEDISVVPFKVGDIAQYVVIDGLDELLEDESLTAQKVSLTIGIMDYDEIADDTAQQEIRKLSKKQKMCYLEIGIDKAVDDDESIALTRTDHVLTLVVPFDTSKSGIKVYRYHDGDPAAEAFTQQSMKMAAPADGNYYVDKANGLIYIYADKFSTYAIGYSTSSSFLPIISDSDNKKEDTQKTDTTVIPTLAFNDIHTYDYYYKAVKWASEKNITSGVSENKFAPFETTTRAQMVTFLWRAAGSPAPAGKTCKFTDIKSSDYYYNAVLWAVEKCYVNGTSDTTFSPDENVTRAQAVTMIARTNAVKDNGAKQASGFADVSANDYFNNAVAWAKKNGIADGTDAVTFSPNEACQRCQVVTFLYRNFNR